MRSISSPRAVSMMMGTSDSVRISRQRSRPSPSGSMTSRRIRSGGVARQAFVAASIVPATSASKPSRPKCSARGSEIVTSSSTTSTRGFMRASYRRPFAANLSLLPLSDGLVSRCAVVWTVIHTAGRRSSPMGSIDRSPTHRSTVPSNEPSDRRSKFTAKGDGRRAGTAAKPGQGTPPFQEYAERAAGTELSDHGHGCRLHSIGSASYLASKAQRADDFRSTLHESDASSVYSARGTIIESYPGCECESDRRSVDLRGPVRG